MKIKDIIYYNDILNQGVLCWAKQNEKLLVYKYQDKKYVFSQDDLFYHKDKDIPPFDENQGVRYESQNF